MSHLELGFLVGENPAVLDRNPFRCHIKRPLVGVISHATDAVNAGAFSMSKSESCLLFHGPRAQDRATEAAKTWGFLARAYGHPIEGFNAEDMREVIHGLHQNPMGGRATVVVGPIDIVTRVGIEDVLLKYLEEFQDHRVRPYLWAYDCGSVRPTIRSRCLDVWSPGVPPPSAYYAKAQEIVQALKERSISGVISALGDAKTWKKVSGPVLEQIPEILKSNPTPEHVLVWLRTRPLLQDDVPLHEAVAGFI